LNREQINIVKFDSGIISNPDPRDITNEAPVESLNIDCNAEDGKLRRVETSGAAYSANGTAIPDVRIGEFIQQGTQYDLIYHDASDNHISAVTNFYGAQAARTLADLITSNVSDETSIVVNNSEVHIGTGDGSANVPKWVGYIEHALFNGFTATDQFNGSGLDDMTGSLAGYTGTANIAFEIEITTAAATDKLKWRKNGGTQSAEIALDVNGVGVAIQLSVDGIVASPDGVTVTFAAKTGHTLNAKWYVIKYQVPTGLQVYNDKLLPPDNISLNNPFTLILTEAAAATTNYFLTTKIYEWGLSFSYDGYQESPIGYRLSDTPSPLQDKA